MICISSHAIVEFIVNTRLDENSDLISLQKAHTLSQNITSNSDLLSDPSSLTESLRKHARGIDYVFFSAYLADPDAEKASESNSNMLLDFLNALRESGATNSVK